MGKTTGVKYKYFSFPNELTSLESYYYYLKEFGIIPKEIDVYKIEEIFTAAAKDFVSKQINQNILSVIVSNLYFSGNTPKILTEVNPQLGWLMDFVSELPWDEKNNPVRFKKTIELLNLYLNDKNSFQEYLSQNKAI